MKRIIVSLICNMALLSSTAVAQATIVQTNQANTYTVGPQDFSGASVNLPATLGFTSNIETYTNGATILGYYNANVGVPMGNQFIWGGGVPNGQTSGGIYYNTSYPSGVGAYANYVINAMGLPNLTTGQFNYCMGAGCDGAITTGYSNVCMGDDCLGNATTGFENTALGDGACNNLTTGFTDICVGVSAGKLLSSGIQNIAIGANSLNSNLTTGGNTAVGYEALASEATSGYNTAVGYNALVQANGNGTNDAFGADSLNADTTGVGNAAFGYYSLGNTNGNYNTAVGFYACSNATSGGSNVCIGPSTQVGTTNSGAIVIGSNASVPSNANNSIAIGFGAAAQHANQTIIGAPGATVQTTVLGIQSQQLSTIASGDTITPTTPVVHVTGRATISVITPPQACLDTGFACTITLIPDSTWSTSNTGNIFRMTYANVGEVLTETYDPGTHKWYPSY